MTNLVRLLALGGAVSLSACAVNPTLMFGDSVSFGLQAGSDAGGVGTGGTLGYKHRSVAVVPVSVLDRDGNGKAIRGTDGNSRGDALSVFASFESTGPAGGNGNVRIGQVFATGSAAQLVTEGVMCQLGGGSSCAPKTAASAAPATSAAAPAAPGTATSGSTNATAGTGQGADTDRPYQAPLFFGRTDTVGLGVVSSAAEQGVQFDLGYTSRNLALVPVFTQGSGNRVDALTSRNAGGKDAMSVIGQFDLDTETRRLGLTLKRYFATGVAAQNIANGLRNAMVAHPAASAASANTD